MEYAIQLLVPLLLGLWGGQALAQWLTAHGGARYDWITIVGCLLGFGMGLAMMYQRLVVYGAKSAKPAKALGDDALKEVPSSEESHHGDS